MICSLQTCVGNLSLLCFASTSSCHAQITATHHTLTRSHGVYHMHIGVTWPCLTNWWKRSCFSGQYITYTGDHVLTAIGMPGLNHQGRAATNGKWHIRKLTGNSLCDDHLATRSLQQCQPHDPAAPRCTRNHPLISRVFLKSSWSLFWYIIAFYSDRANTTPLEHSYETPPPCWLDRWK